MVIATLLRKLQAVKDVLRPLSKKHRFRIPFESQHVKRSQTLINLYESTFIIFLITLRELDLRNISLSDILNLRGFS